MAVVGIGAKTLGTVLALPPKVKILHLLRSRNSALKLITPKNKTKQKKLLQNFDGIILKNIYNSTVHKSKILGIT